MNKPDPAGNCLPPSGLGDAGEALWRAVTAAEEGESIELRPDERQNLEEAAKTADLIAKLHQQIDAADSLLVDGSKGQPTLHPMVPEIRQQRALLGQLLGRLNFDAGEGGGSAWDGLTASDRGRKAALIRHQGRG